MAALSWTALACGTGGSAPGTPDAEAPEELEDDAPSPCSELRIDGALAAFEGKPCPWALRPSADAGVELVHSTASPTSTPGETPAPCLSLPCSFRGVETPLGPMVIVEVADAGSEVPAGVWLGFVQGETLSFVDLWDDAGDPVMDDGIAIGPAHALTPFDCEGRLALFSAPRLPGAAAVPPPASLVGREGAVDAQAGALRRERCETLPLALP